VNKDQYYDSSCQNQQRNQEMTVCYYRLEGIHLIPGDCVTSPGRSHAWWDSTMGKRVQPAKRLQALSTENSIMVSWFAADPMSLPLTNCGTVYKLKLALLARVEPGLSALDRHSLWY
jgi:hypothetical protein